ncbi:Carboxylate-amine ligase YbdK [Nonomuraea coxensis DSM 45129]|uniref:Putative glutamate--cysteine ligase 2 n=1 Tax=Nonomuraea coxensis DSM 45129 TaxID=1122611 RepID=A0ABX8U6D7_9ACTN|nr:glutamate-cysteine ligase family protein [Nonomuraea coxensis]QYC42207.1 Carboxylate-amine ligase YbdK [Nonomuraea coxensis DSM 45129]
MAATDLTMGVEEGFMLLDPATATVMPVAGDVRERAGGSARDQVTTGTTASQIETRSGPHTELAGLREELLRLRAAVVSAADRAGAGVAATGTALRGGLPGEAGCHVWLGVDDREEAVQVVNHLRPWLPVLQALTVNSPIGGGTDTGWASGRARARASRPAAGPPPWFRSAEHHDWLAEGLHGTGAVPEWQARLSSGGPAIEVRVADTCQTVAEVVLLAGLVRALAATALGDVRAGRPAPDVDHTLLAAASWRAARDGLEGENVDQLTGRRLPVWRLVDTLIDRVGPALRALGDLPLMDEGLDVLHRHGSGAARQRAAYRRRGLVADVARLLADRSRQDLPRLAG